MKTEKSTAGMTTGQLIRHYRLLKSRRLHAALEPAPAARINLEQMYRQADLAAEAGITQSRISLWEKGHVVPAVESLRRVAKALEVPASALID